MSEHDAPGLKRRPRSDGTIAYYWVAAAVSRRAKDYPLKTIRLHGKTEAEAADRCRLLTAELYEWIALKDQEAPPEFDDKIGSLIDIYQRDEDSPYHSVKATTRASYDGDLRILRRTLGDRSDIGGLTRKDFKKWHQAFIAPASKDGPRRVRRAHGLMTMLRMLFSFGVSMRLAGCAEAKAVLDEMTFESPARRDEAITFDQAAAVVDKAAEASVRSIALGQALQFELGLRQIDVVGQWVAAPDGMVGITFRGKAWTGGITWSDLTAERLAKRTSKTGQEGQWNPALYPLLQKAMALFADSERVGPAIIDERTGQPYKPKEYSRVWRTFANAAGLPGAMWNMDSRAGALSEADDAGAQPDDMRKFATHANSQTTQRYIRRTLEATSRVARLRVAHREKQKDGSK